MFAVALGISSTLLYSSLIIMFVIIYSKLLLISKVQILEMEVYDGIGSVGRVRECLGLVSATFTRLKLP